MDTFIVIRISFLLFLLVLLGSASANPQVPGVGSTWKSTLTYKSFGDQGSTRSRDETYVVKELKDGVPVFSGEVFGYKGEIVESDSGTVVYTDDCKEKIPPEMFAPPQEPNQCVWGVCKAPPVGNTLSRPMVFFTNLHGCEAKVATYSFKATRKGNYQGTEVTIGEAKVFLSTFSQTTWTSYVQDGRGEIFAESPARETKYSLIDIKPAQYQVRTQHLTPKPLLTLVPTEEVKKITQCDIVAFGDSLTEGLGAKKVESYPSQLSKKLSREVCNLGISGNTTAVAKERLGEVLNLKPKVVIISLGANDALQGVTPEVTKGNLEHILRVFKEQGIISVVLGFDSVATKMPDYIRKMLAAYDVAKNQEDVLYLHDAFVGILDNKEMISSDGQHPNAAGYKLLARNIMEQAFGPLLVTPSLAK